MAFVPEAFLIALREGLEAFLIVGLLLGLVVKLERPDARKWVWAGFAAALVASVALGVIIQQFLLAPFEENGGGEWFELVAALAAVGVLTYMVFWMWRQTRELMAGLRKQVAAALTKGSLVAVAFLAFASVLREGLEVVLFYSALAAQNTPFELVWSGLVGAVLSLGIVAVILGTSMRFDLSKFFAITGILLVFIASGLLVHSVHAAMGIGLLPQAETAIWNTGNIIPNDSATGRVLHAIFGYEAAPTLLQAVLYFGYLFGVGITYLWKIGVFHRATTQGPAMRRGMVTAVAVLVVLASTMTAIGAANPVPADSHDHGPGEDHNADGDVVEIGQWYDDERQGLHLDVAEDDLPDKVGVLLRFHGEPIHYNATTYQSFRGFYEGILKGAGLGDSLLVDQGTVLLDRGAPFATTPRPLPELFDAWTDPFMLPGAVPVSDPAGMGLGGTYYVAPAGPGLGEPDILEIFGLGTWKEWMKLGGASPMHESQAPYRANAESLLERVLGDRVMVENAFHIEPGITKGEGETAAIERLVAAGVDVIVDTYGSAMHSDVMDGCMMQPHVHHALEAAGFDGTYLKASNPGGNIRWAQAVVDRAARALDQLPLEADDQVALLLTHHGLTPGSPSPCKDRVDPYHAQAAELFAQVEDLMATSGLAERFVLVEQVYGQAADDDSDPDNEVASSQEAFARARAAGATHVIDIPYELSGDGYDNLNAHRENWGFTHEEAPYYDDQGETRFVRNGIAVWITSSTFGHDLRGAALAAGVLEALAEHYGAATPGDDHGH